MEKGRNLISKVIRLLHSNVQFSTKKSQGTQRKRKYDSFTGEKTATTETVPENDLMADLPGKDFKQLS